MSFDNKDYPNRKDNRRHYKYEASKSCSRGCRNNGSCNYCEGSRLIKNTKNALIAKSELASFIMNKEDLMEGIGGA